MIVTMPDITEQVLSFPQQGRAFLTEKLLESLDSDSNFKLSNEWKKEINKRCNEINAGDVDLIPSEEVFDKAFKEKTKILGKKL